MPLQPPPEAAFDTKSSAIAYAQIWGGAEGYAVVTTSSAKGGRYVYLGCDKGGKYKNCRGLNEENRQRKSATSKVGCFFKLRLKNENDGLWHLVVVNAHHNDHEVSTNIIAHPILRRLDAVAKEYVLELSQHNTRPAQIVALLAQREEPIVVRPKDVSNFIQQHRREHLGGRAPAEALMEWLKEKNWPHRAQFHFVDAHTQRLGGLIFAHPRCLELLARFYTVLIIDATYSTNQHKMPLLHFVGLTSSNRTFTAALGFLEDETTATYQWALETLHQLVPSWKPGVVVTDHDAALTSAISSHLPTSVAHILCQWHVRQNVEKFARSRLQNEDEYQSLLSDFDELKMSRTCEELVASFQQFTEQWSHQPDLVT
ncbi:hypothetical protein CF328_g9452, partial [Tilletia controversa]